MKKVYYLKEVGGWFPPFPSLSFVEEFGSSDSVLNLNDGEDEEAEEKVFGCLFSCLIKTLVHQSSCS